MVFGFLINSCCNDTQAVDESAFFKPPPSLLGGKSSSVTTLSYDVLDDASSCAALSAVSDLSNVSTSWAALKQRKAAAAASSASTSSRRRSYRATTRLDRTPENNKEIKFIPDIFVPESPVDNINLAVVTEEEEQEEDQDIISMFGDNFLTNTSTKKIPVLEALWDSELVAIVYGNFGRKSREMQKVTYFSSGYDSSIAFVRVTPSKSAFLAPTKGRSSGFERSPLSWYTLEDIENTADLEHELQLGVSGKPKVIIVDVRSRKVLSRDALVQVCALDTTNAQSYDSDSVSLVQRWIGGVGLKQQRVGEMIPFP